MSFKFSKDENGYTVLHDMGPPRCTVSTDTRELSETAERIAKAGRADALPGLPDPKPKSKLTELQKILREVEELHLRKGADYGTEEDDCANLRASEAFGIKAWVGAMIRKQDKMTRIQSFIRKGWLENESIEDAIIDDITYGCLALKLYREGK